MNARKSLAMALAGSLLLAACAQGPQPIGGVGAQYVTVDSMPAPDGIDLHTGTFPYRVEMGDTLDIDVFGVDEMKRQVMVDGSGNIAFPYVGTINVEGQGPQQIARTLEQKLRGRIVRDPSVTVNVKDMREYKVTVDGQVAKPGVYPVKGRISLMQAVASAGGINEFGKLDDVVVFRKANGQDYVGLYNIKAIRRGTYADPDIYPEDIVVVGDSPARRTFKDIVAAATLITTPLIILFR